MAILEGDKHKKMKKVVFFSRQTENTSHRLTFELTKVIDTNKP